MITIPRMNDGLGPADIRTAVASLRFLHRSSSGSGPIIPGVRSEQEAACSRRRTRRPVSGFRKACRARSHSHLPHIQCLPKIPRTCFEGPFGEVIRATGPMAKANPFRFSTKYQDDETDLLYYGYRYYTASTGRWLSRDPLGEKAAFNLYGFVNGNPLSRIDTDGREIGNICPICGSYYVGVCPNDGYPKNVKPRGGGTFEFCRRYIQDPQGCCSKAANSCCGLHSYTRYTDSSGKRHGWGHAEGGPHDEPDTLLNAKETKCASCTLAMGGLKYGKGKGKRGVDATGDEIYDCLRNRPSKGPFDSLWNNCWEYSIGAQGDCGLRCSWP
jgi:RHS repeat-associated protein